MSVLKILRSYINLNTRHNLTTKEIVECKQGVLKQLSALFNQASS